MHNEGMGLDNIRSSCTENDKLSIFSNMVSLEADSEDVSVHKLDFKGTLRISRKSMCLQRQRVNVCIEQKNASTYGPMLYAESPAPSA